ncbi:MAG TPA: protein kinase [Kofleriaceae bacterium]|nr:protein kinase [Kofleriaceae bacterium]
MLASEGVGRFVGDRYRIVRELGRGGMGVVYLGRDLRRDMDVAIKFRSFIHHDATLWLKREFRAVASLRHANLVELYELVVTDQACYFTMEYVPGLDPRRHVLRSRVPVIDLELAHQVTHQTAVSLAPPAPAPPRKVPDVDFGRVRAVLAQLADALAFLHARGVIHRDVKPSNSIVTASGAVKLLDFGLALEHRRAAEELARETRVVGTAAYLAPEYIERLTVSPAIDVYALGVLGYELVTGAPPFGGTVSVLQRLGQQLVLPRASSINPAVPDDLDELLAHVLATDPVDRPSALDVALRLTGELSQPHAVRRVQRFVGRERELAQIARRIADPEPRGRLVLVAGPSGAGKTALVDEATGRARELALVWRGRCHDREQVPYRAFDFVIDDLASELAGNPRLATAIEHAPALARVFPALGAQLEDVAGPPAEDLRVERERALGAMVQLFEHVLSPREGDPRAGFGLIVIDDLQWADDDSLELLARLVELCARPLTIVASWTVEGALPPRLAALVERLGRAADPIELGAMPHGELAALIADVAPAASLDRLRAAAELAAGSPYLAELIGLELAAAGTADPQDAERRRLDRLSAHERAIAELCALAGGSASFEQLRALAGVPGAQLQSALRGLEDGRIVRLIPSATGEPAYAFYHQRLRDAAHAAIAPPTRRALHRRFAEQIEAGRAAPDQLAFHWEMAGEPGRAASWAAAAGDAARAQLAWALAADWYGRALALGADEAVRAAKAEAELLAGKLADAAREFERLAAGGQGGDRYLVRAAEAHIKLGETERGLAILDDVLARHGRPRARSRRTSALRAAAVAARWLVPRALRPRAEQDDVLAAAYRVIASFLSTPYPIESFEYVLRGLDLAARSGDRDAQGLGMAMLAAYLAAASMGRFGDAAIARARRLASASDAPYPRMVAAGAAGILATLRGDWTGMRDEHEEGERICRRLGLERSWEASFLRTYWALGEYYAGEPTRALRMLGELAETSDDLISRALLGSYRGRALVLDGELAPARALARELERSPAAARGMAGIYRQVLAGELALADREWARAAEIGRQAARFARAEWLSAMPAISAMVDVVSATAELGLAAAGDRAAAARARGHARALYRRGKTTFYAATALRLWGQAELLLGERDTARRVLARAVEVARARGGKVDRLALAALTGAPYLPGKLAAAVAWSTGGTILE